MSWRAGPFLGGVESDIPANSLWQTWLARHDYGLVTHVLLRFSDSAAKHVLPKKRQFGPLPVYAPTVWLRVCGTVLEKLLLFQ